ncbi:MurR/RpiR family transcriptional regulator [Bhargavaea ullalensis]|uniref:DNA-binding MurR/RpiR family transcriptional regulator n=1 Tax=Bhargavaea ullalensis TaxID=1265685 RepID=A0ABV2GCW7_9BACL
MDEILSKIKEQQPTFSNALNKIAGFFFSDPKIFAVSSAKEAGYKIGVSETSIIRFCQKLGYEGYGELQQDVQSRIFEKSSLSVYVSQKESQDDSIKSTMARDLENIKKLMENSSEENLTEAVKRLSRSERTLVTGAGPSSSMAAWFSFALDMVCGNTRVFFPDHDNILLRINELNENSVFVAFTFHRYNKGTILSAKTAKEKGSFVIGITDHRFSPISEVADLLLPVELGIKSSLDSAPAVFSLMNSIVFAISSQNPEFIQERMKLLDTANARDFFI